MVYMVIEHFKNGDPVPVYRRFQTEGRLTPDGLVYISSWIDAALTRCFQVMETADPALLNQWISRWSDLIDFEVIPVVSSSEASSSIALKP